jgi:hypothetical protein
MHKHFALSVATIVGLTTQCWAPNAQATSTSVSPTSTTLHVAISDSQQVSGVRTFDVGVTQTDGGVLCTKITQVQILDKAKGLMLGSKVLARSLCNFNPADATVTVTPWSDASLASVCNGKPGQTVPLTMIMDT